MAYNGDPEADLMTQYFDWDKNTMSLAALLNAVENAYNNVIRNKKDPKNVPVVVKFDNLTYAIPFYGFSFAVGNKGFSAFIETGNYHKIMPIVPDIRPESGEGEYWSSRGPGYPDISGFVKSKQAGERIDKMVSEIIGDNHKSWLDYRETEPTWIQYKFHQDEFDLEMLDKLSKENNGIITKDIIKKCIKEI